MNKYVLAGLITFGIIGGLFGFLFLGLAHPMLLAVFIIVTTVIIVIFGIYGLVLDWIEQDF